jgi:PAS domain S-box-containing protein
MTDSNLTNLTEEAMSESEDGLRLLLSGIKDYAIFMLDAKGIVKTWNYGAQRIKGYTADEIIGKHFSCFYSEEDKGDNKPGEALEIAGKLGRYEEDGILLRKDGQPFGANVIIVPLYDNQKQLVIGFVTVTRDITEQKQAIDKLKEQADLLNLTHDAVIVRSLDGVIHYWNCGAKDVYGFTEEEAIGQISHDLMKTKHPKPLTEIEQEILVECCWEGELIQTRRDGQIITVASRQVLRTDAQGRPTGILETDTDVTAHKLAENRRVALTKIEVVNVELEQFASVVSHDLQEPLRAIAGCLQILEKTYKERLDATADELINHAVEGAVRMQALIAHLLALARISGGEFALEPTDLSSVLEQVLKNMESTIKQSGTVVTHDPLPVIMADKTQIAQLFQNLISNAIKFCQNKAAKIHISATMQDEQWQICVSDNGIGFEKEASDQIFSPFKRLHTRSQYPGTGLGLAICKKIVEKHNGAIWAKSEPGKGAQFYFTIK